MYIRNIISSIALITMLIYFAYKGYFPFNANYGKDIHYWVYDSYKLAFNIPNYYDNGIPYYCKSKYNNEIAEIFEKTRNLNNDINEIENSIKELEKKKIPVSTYELERVKSLYDQAHIFRDNYYINKANNELKVINSNYQYNNKINIIIEKLNDEIKYINNVEIPNNNKEMLKYCKKLI